MHAFAEASASPTGRAALQILLRRVDEEKGLHRIGVELLDQRTGHLQRRLDRAAEMGQLPSADAAFVNMMLAGPVQWFVLRRSRAFTLDDAREVVELVVEGLRHRKWL